MCWQEFFTYALDAATEQPAAPSIETLEGRYLESLDPIYKKQREWRGETGTAKPQEFLAFARSVLYVGGGSGVLVGLIGLWGVRSSKKKSKAPE